MDAYIGEIRAFGFNFATDAWLPCNGQILNANQYQALYAVIGNQFGGTPTSTFALPNLCGYVPAGLTAASPLGQRQGTESQALTLDAIASHSHAAAPSYPTDSTISMYAACSAAPTAGASLYHVIEGVSSTSPAGKVVPTYILGTASPQVPLAAASVGTTGSGTAHENRQPFQVFNFMICFMGEFPTPA
jgi:microcystin-dependent protein